ncbi:hypothetical protein VPNG_05894 [Cytospora leucostoma]|uniref:EKC/KEOPS complex subunit BUD32 n=1 Tax=Cytospora leucostoma TaxID=1230097 RepID=A0A423X0D8_9PEZI|nr:hypothetical protein VPNG_05894 [Cytospora leucostoma]
MSVPIMTSSPVDDSLAPARADGHVQYNPTAFAYLTPENGPAQKALVSLVSRQANPDSGFLIERVPDADINNSPGSSNRAAKSTYRFVLSLDKAGSGHDGSWKFGKGSKFNAVDIQVCSPKSRQLTGGLIGIIFMHPDSGVFVLQNVSEKHSIVYLQANVELGYRDKHVLYMTSNQLRFGPFDYVLEFGVASEVRFLNDRTLYRRTGRHDDDDQELPPPLLDLLPKPTHQRIGDIIIHQTISKGAFGVVRIGVHRRSGDIVACKTIHCGKRDVAVTKRELMLASSIPTTTVGVVPLLFTWCEHGHSPPCLQTTSEVEDVHLLMPYARYDFNNAPWPEVPMATRLALFRQVLEGLRNLHAAGIMHRDISPKNLLILSLRTPKAGICDFGKSKRGTSGVNKALGPPQYTAPEVWRQREYSNAIDIFSLGLTMLKTFQGWQPMRQMDASSHEAVLGHLASLRGRIMPEDLGDLLRSMLAWNPADRPTAEQALEDKAWELVSEAQSSESDTSSGSARKKRMRRASGPSPASPS